MDDVSSLPPTLQKLSQEVLDESAAILYKHRSYGTSVCTVLIGWWSHNIQSQLINSHEPNMRKAQLFIIMSHPPASMASHD